MDEWQQGEFISAAFASLNVQIRTETYVKPFVNSGNGHHDLLSAVRRAIEPGGPLTPNGITFRTVTV